jgi:hypothetical protein
MRTRHRWAFVTGSSESRKASNVADGAARHDAGPLREPAAAARPEYVQVTPCEFDARVGRVDFRARYAPYDRRTRALPTDRDRAGGRSVSQRVRIDAERATGSVIRHARITEECLQLCCGLFRAATA